MGQYQHYGHPMGHLISIFYYSVGLDDEQEEAGLLGGPAAVRAPDRSEDDRRAARGTAHCQEHARGGRDQATGTFFCSVLNFRAFCLQLCFQMILLAGGTQLELKLPI